jgi:hypothetical protein
MATRRAQAAGADALEETLAAVKAEAELAIARYRIGFFAFSVALTVVINALRFARGLPHSWFSPGFFAVGVAYAVIVRRLVARRGPSAATTYTTLFLDPFLAVGNLPLLRLFVPQLAPTNAKYALHIAVPMLFVSLLITARRQDRRATVVGGATHAAAALWLLASVEGLEPGMFVTATAFGLATAVGLALARQGRHTLELFATPVQALQRATNTLNDELRDRVTQLEERNREIQTLAEELQRQVVARSRELAAVLAAQDAPSSAARLEPGAMFDGRYRVVRLLGQGGMGMVYEVERTADGRTFALKLVTGAMSSAAATRFAREAEIGASVRHPYVVGIIDVGVTRTGSPFLVMELVEGGSLEASRARFGDPAWAMPLLRAIGAGVAALHAAGIVHRDLKPPNVLLAPQRDGVVPKIADFGISRFDEPDEGAFDPIAETMRANVAGKVTGTGMLLGTPIYMAPEAAKGGRAAGAPADVFAFGTMAYEMLTGVAPFDAPPIFRMLAGLPIPAPAPLSKLDGSLERIGSIVLECLAVEPSARPSMTDVLAVLAASRHTDETVPSPNVSR